MARIGEADPVPLAAAVAAEASVATRFAGVLDGFRLQEINLVTLQFLLELTIQITHKLDNFCGSYPSKKSVGIVRARTARFFWNNFLLKPIKAAARQADYFIIGASHEYRKGQSFQGD
jgi:hypothetical protein